MVNFNRSKNEYTLSVYSGELTQQGAAKAFELIKKSFSKLDRGFFDMLFDRAKKLNFSDARLIDSINHVIDNCQYPEPTIAQFISFDKKIKLFTHPQIVELNNETHGQAFKYYSSVKIEGFDKPFWASNIDIHTFKLKLWKDYISENQQVKEKKQK